MDIVLGAKAFHLNNQHMVISEGAMGPGKKAKAKEELFQHILGLIRQVNKNADF